MALPGHSDHQGIHRDTGSTAELREVLEVWESQKPEDVHLNLLQEEGQVLEDFTKPRGHRLVQEQEVNPSGHLPALGQDYLNKVLQDIKVDMILEMVEDFNNLQVHRGLSRLVLSSPVPEVLRQNTVQKYSGHKALLPAFLEVLADNIPSA